MKGHPNPNVRTTEEKEIVGPKMHEAVQKVDSSGPYPSKNALAKRVGPHGSQNYGYRIVNRCKSKGLLAVDSEHPDATPSGNGAVVLTDKGRKYLDDH